MTNLIAEVTSLKAALNTPPFNYNETWSLRIVFHKEKSDISENWSLEGDTLIIHIVKEKVVSLFPHDTQVIEGFYK